jgi:hypothetical protein
LVAGPGLVVDTQLRIGLSTTTKKNYTNKTSMITKRNTTKEIAAAIIKTGKRAAVFFDVLKYGDQQYYNGYYQTDV